MQMEEQIPLTLRYAVPEDIDAIARLLSQLNVLEGHDPAINVEGLLEGLFSIPQHVVLRALVAELEGQVVAVVFFYPGYDVLTVSHGYHLADFVVDERYRQQGIGKRLFAALAFENLREGGQWVSLTVLKKNKAAQGFYRSLGMVNVEVDFFAVGQRALVQLVQSIM